MSGIHWWFRSSLAVGMLAGLVTCQSGETSTGQGLAQTVPYYNTPAFTPIWLTDSTEADHAITHRIADFQFRDQTNAVVSQQTIASKITVANFFFTICPSICPKMTDLLLTVQDTFRDEPRVALLSFSVTPWIDSIPRLRRYAENKGVISGKCHLLTGEKGKIYELARRSYFAEEAIGFTRDSTEFLHTEHLILVDERRRIRGIYNGTQPQEVDQLIADMRALLGR